LGIVVGFIHGSSWCDWSTTGPGNSEIKILND